MAFWFEDRERYQRLYAKADSKAYTGHNDRLSAGQTLVVAVLEQMPEIVFR